MPHLFQGLGDPLHILGGKPQFALAFLQDILSSLLLDKLKYILERTTVIIFGFGITDEVDDRAGREEVDDLAGLARQISARGDSELTRVLAAELARALVPDLVGGGGDRGAARRQQPPRLEQAELLLVLQRRRRGGNR